MSVDDNDRCDPVEVENVREAFRVISGLNDRERRLFMRCILLSRGGRVARAASLLSPRMGGLNGDGY